MSDSFIYNAPMWYDLNNISSNSDHAEWLESEDAHHLEDPLRPEPSKPLLEQVITKPKVLTIPKSPKLHTSTRQSRTSSRTFSTPSIQKTTKMSDKFTPSIKKPITTPKVVPRVMSTPKVAPRVQATPKAVPKPTVQATPKALPRYMQPTPKATPRVAQVQSKPMVTPKYTRPVVTKPIATPKVAPKPIVKPIVKETPKKPEATPSKWTRTVWQKSKATPKPVYKPPAKVVQQVAKSVVATPKATTIPQAPKLSASINRSSVNLSMNTSVNTSTTSMKGLEKKLFYEKPKLIKPQAKQPVVQRFPVRKNVNASLNGTLTNITNISLNTSKQLDTSISKTTVDTPLDNSSVTTPGLSTFERLKRKVESIGHRKFV